MKCERCKTEDWVMIHDSIDPLFSEKGLSVTEKIICQCKKCGFKKAKLVNPFEYDHFAYKEDQQ